MQVGEKGPGSSELCREEGDKAEKTVIKPADETRTTLFAIFTKGFSIDVVKFESDNLKRSVKLGEVDGDINSKTAFLKDTIYIIGGWEGDNQKRVSTFNVITCEKRRMANLRIRRAMGHAVVTSSDKIFACGGISLEAGKSCEVFDLEQNQWRLLSDLQQGRINHAIAILPDGRLVVTGGWNTEKLASCEMINTNSQSDIWRSVAPMKQPRLKHAACCFEGLVYVVGSFDPNLTSVEVFTPPPLESSPTELGQWTYLSSSMTRGFNDTKSLVPVSPNEIIAFSCERQAESLKKTTKLSSEGDILETWKWTSLANFDKSVISVNGVHCTYCIPTSL